MNDEQTKRRDELAEKYADNLKPHLDLHLPTIDFKAGYDVGFSDCRDEMRYDVHTCHDQCTRLHCVQRREIDELRRKLEVAIRALEFYADKENWIDNNAYDQKAPQNIIGNTDLERNKPFFYDVGGKTAREALKEIE